MKVLLSGGRKTKNIINGINKNFTTSGDEFVVIEYLDDILDMFSRGEYFDKAVITEQSITRDGEIKDAMTIRHRINSFSIDISEKPRRGNYVFLAQDEDIANMIYDEILPISNDSAVVYRKPPYKVTFFVDLIVKEAGELPSEWVFEPELAIPETNTLGIDDMEISENTEVDNDIDMDIGIELPEMPTEDVFGGDFSSIDNQYDDISNSFETDNGSEIEINEIPDNLDELLDENSADYTDENYDNTGEFENNFDEEFDGSFDSIEDTDEMQIQSQFKTDEVLETDVMDPIKQSGDLPEYTEDEEQSDENLFATEEPFDSFDTEALNTEESFTTDESFTDESFTTDESLTDESFTDESFTTDESFDNTEQLTGEYFSDESFNFDNTESFTDESFEDEYKQEGKVMGNDLDNNMYQDNSDMYQESNFDNNMYGDDNEENTEEGSEYSDDFGSDMYGEQQDDSENNESIDGFDDRAYQNIDKLNKQDMAARQAMENNMPKTKMQVNKKRGIRGLFGGSQKSNKYQNMSKQLNEAQAVASWQQETSNNNKSKKNKVDVKYIKQQLKPFASRGNSIVVTGCGGCGTSVVAYNLANIINQLGYSVLLVDMDTEGRTQSYISKTNYDSMEPEGANLMSAVNSSNGISAQEAIVKQGFHLLTMGLGTDTAPVNELLHKEKISRFVNLAKTSANFVVYDIPFNSATGFLSEVTYMSDNLVLVADASNWGLTKMMLNVCNIGLDDMQDTIFSRAQLVFNRYRNLTKVLGRKVRTGVDITKALDLKVQELIGEDPGFHFEDLHIAGIINDDPDFENGWFDNVQYTDTNKGQAIFLELLEHIILKG